MLQDGTNPAEVILKEGLAKLRPGREADKRSPLFQKLEIAAQVAQETNAGMWNPAPGTVASHVRDVKVSFPCAAWWMPCVVMPAHRVPACSGV